jgi:hypothetical protein
MATVRKDFAIDSDLIIRNGDYVFEESDNQHVIDSINSHAGWWKEFPLDGVGISDFSNSTGGAQQLARKIKIELKKDDYSVENPVIEFSTDGKLNIYPNASRV